LILYHCLRDGPGFGCRQHITNAPPSRYIIAWEIAATTSYPESNKFFLNLHLRSLVKRHSRKGRNAVSPDRGDPSWHPRTCRGSGTATTSRLS